jgi:hypothetical protein
MQETDVEGRVHIPKQEITQSKEKFRAEWRAFAETRPPTRRPPRTKEQLERIIAALAQVSGQDKS